MRPAPVQLSWLGYFGSTGLPAIDAVLVGDALAPAGSEAFYTEPLERVSGVHFAYAPPPYAPPVAAPPSAHNGIITFGSFNNLAKITPEMIALWSSMLKPIVATCQLLLRTLAIWPLPRKIEDGKIT